MSDIERELRDSLAENARRAPAGGGLAERIIADAQRGRGAHDRPSARSRWRAWSLPAVAAACVAGVVALIAIVASLQHPQTHSASTSSLHTTPPPTSAAVTSSAPASTAASSNPATSNAPTSSAPGTGRVPDGFTVSDLTFVGSEEGWALGSAQCLNNSAKRCIALLWTTDGGQHWGSVKNPAANVSIAGKCDAPCIEHIRFADDKVGYAYGQNALFMTTDGGAHWTRQAGGADALETLSHNVIRVTDTGNCPPACSYEVWTAPVGGSEWQKAGLPGSVNGDSVLLSRTGDAAYLLIRQNPAGGAGSEQSTLLASSDDGRSWQKRDTTCPQSSGEIDANLMTTADDGSVTLLCTPRLGSGPQFTVTSTDGGSTFRPGRRQALGSFSAGALGAASNSVLLVSSDDTYRSSDGGQTWSRLGANSGSDPGQVSWIGFENGTVGRAISTDGRTVWTTTDAGSTWTGHTFK
jgi:photosystem II stability/assembly factor-like uncharacterized protein